LIETKNMTGIVKTITVALVLCLVAGCSSLNPFARKTPRNKPAELTAFTASATLAPVWSATVGSADKYMFTPALAGGSVFAAANNGNIVRLDAASGREEWRIDAGTRLTAGVASNGTTVVVGAAEGVLLAFDGDGKQRWKAQASSEILSAPAIAQDLVIVRSMDNRIAAFDIESGVRRWVIQRTVPPLTLRAAPGIVAEDQTAYVSLPGGRLLALATINGGPRWEIAIGDPRGTTELERVADVSGYPAVTESLVCAAAYQSRIGCVDRSSGAGRWVKPFSSSVGVGADASNLYAADETGVLNAFSLDSGTSVWRNNQLQYRDLSAPTAFGNGVAVGDGFGYIHLLGRENGAFAARIATDGSAIRSAPVRSGNQLIVQTQAGRIMALVQE